MADKNNVNLENSFMAFANVARAFRNSPPKTKEIALLDDENNIIFSFQEKDLKTFETSFANALSRAKMTGRKKASNTKTKDPSSQTGVYAIVRMSPTLIRFMSYFDKIMMKDGKSLGSLLKQAKKGYIMRNSLTMLFPIFFSEQIKESEDDKLRITKEFLDFFDKKGEQPFFVYVPNSREDDEEAKGYKKMSVKEAIEEELVSKDITTFKSLVFSGKINDKNKPYKRIVSQSIASGNYKTETQLEMDKKEAESKGLKDLVEKYEEYLENINSPKVKEETLEEHQLICEFKNELKK